MEGGKRFVVTPHLQEELDGLGAGDTCGPTGNVLRDNAEGAAAAAVAAAVVLGQGETPRRSGPEPGGPAGRSEGGARTCASVYSQLPSKLYRSPSKVIKWPSP